MLLKEDIESQRQLVKHLLESVPFGKNDHGPSFLDVYNISNADMAALDFSEAAWDLRFALLANKLLKLGISFGNLLKIFQNDQKAHEAKEAREAQLTKNRTPTQNSDPFSEGFEARKINHVHPYYIKFAQNLFHILKNFDVSPHTHTPRTTLDSDQTSANGSQNSVGGVASSPIKLNSRQLLIEKLEINIRLDALFTFKVVLLLLVQIYDILTQLLREFIDSGIDRVGLRNDADNASVLSYTSNNLGGPPISGAVLTSADYIRLTRAILYRIHGGIVGPFVQTLVTELVDTQVASAFQTLVTNI